jgi:thioredoxin reductase-like selenoprotein T
VPNLEISGTTHSAGPLKEAIGQFLGYGLFAAIAVATGLVNSFLPAEAAQWVEQNRGMVIGAGFLLNMVSNSLTQTGAFEVYVDGELVFSKLKVGNMVHTEQLVALIRQRLVNN